MARFVYLDNAATTCVDPAVFESMKPYFCAQYGNPMTSGHSALGEAARRALETARSEVAALIGADPRRIAFTSGGTESDNWAVKGTLEKALERAGARPAHVVTSAFEHPAVTASVDAMRRRGVEASYLRVGQGGVVDPDDLRKAMRPTTALVSVMHANNEVGTIQPIAELAAVAHEGGALLHVDAVQTAGHIPVDVDALGVDFLSLSGHKFNGPKGVGALYARDWDSLYPFMDGGAQEWGGLRGSTHNVPGIVGLGTAARLAAPRAANDARRVAILRDRLFTTLSARIDRLRINGDQSKRVPHILNARFPGVDNESLLLAMGEAGILAAACSACHSGRNAVSPTLAAMGLGEADARSSLRLSLGYQTTAEDVDYVCGVLPGLVRLLRSRA